MLARRRCLVSFCSAKKHYPSVACDARTMLVYTSLHPCSKIHDQGAASDRTFHVMVSLQLDPPGWGKTAVTKKQTIVLRAFLALTQPILCTSILLLDTTLYRKDELTALKRLRLSTHPWWKPLWREWDRVWILGGNLSGLYPLAMCFAKTCCAAINPLRLNFAFFFPLSVIATKAVGKSTVLRWN